MEYCLMKNGAILQKDGSWQPTFKNKAIFGSKDEAKKVLAELKIKASIVELP
mgnify:CR=1 FL=1